MFLRMIYDERLAQAAWLIGCQQTGEAIIIDPERDVDRYLEVAAANELRIVAAAETHIHADFLSGARELAERVGATVYLSVEGDADWKYEWLDKKADGGTYPHKLLKDGDTFRIGGIHFRVVHTPGHTPEHIVFVVTDEGGGASEPIGAVTGDFLFVGDLGRPDLLESAAGKQGAMTPSAKQLYHSLARVGEFEDYVQVWPGHGAGSACGKALGAVPTSTLGYERRFNEALQHATSEEAFVEFILAGQPEPPLYFARMKRDNKLGPPLLGELPQPAPLEADALAKLRKQYGEDKLAIVDTRPWEEFRTGHLAGALSLPLKKEFPTNAGSLIGAEEAIVLVARPEDVEEAVRNLVRIGYDRIVGYLPAEALTQQAGFELPTSEFVDVAEAQRAIQAGEVHVLDVRRASEFAEGHIDTAANVAHTRLLSRLDEVPRDKPLLVVCRSGNRSARAASLLQRRGYRALNLEGGMLAWKAAQSGATSQATVGT